VTSPQLPPNWTRMSLRDLVVPSRRRHPRQEDAATFTYIDIDAVDNHSNRVVKPRPIRREDAPSRATNDVRTGDVLFSLVRPYLRNVARVTAELDGGVASSAFCVLRPSDAISSDYLFYALLRPDFIHKVKTYGESPPSARDTEFLDLEIPVAPKSVQPLVVRCLEAQLSRLDAAGAALSSAAANLRRYRMSVITGGATGTLLPSGDPASEAIQPSKWSWMTLGEVADIAGGVTVDQKREALSGLEEVPYLRVANVQRGYLDLRVVKTIRARRDDIARLRLHPGDILFNEGGDRDKLGRGWVWSGEIDPCIHQNHVFRARLTKSSLLPKFVSWYANSVGRAYFLSRGKQTTNLASVSRRQLGELPLPVPPLLEQQAIVAELERRLSVVDAMDVALAQGMARAASLRSAVLGAAFSGHFLGAELGDMWSHQ
jgi:type I restriction enzyme, S subunit